MSATYYPDVPHEYERGFTSQNMIEGADRETLEICNRCGTTRKLGNHIERA